MGHSRRRKFSRGAGQCVILSIGAGREMKDEDLRPAAGSTSVSDKNSLISLRMSASTRMLIRIVSEATCLFA